jgi:hypothetical protein
MGYNHTQKAPLHLIFYPLVIWLLVLAWMSRQQPVAALISVAGAVFFIATAFMFRQLTVRDEGEWLAIRFGPLPVFRKRIAYGDISSVESSRSALIDGWGIHCFPGRGCTYNLWGFDCAQLRVQGKTIRVGSDDVENLVAFLRTKLPPHATGPASNVVASAGR